MNASFYHFLSLAGTDHAGKCDHYGYSSLSTSQDGFSIFGIFIFVQFQGLKIQSKTIPQSFVLSFQPQVTLWVLQRYDLPGRPFSLPARSSFNGRWSNAEKMPFQNHMHVSEI